MPGFGWSEEKLGHPAPAAGAIQLFEETSHLDRVVAYPGHHPRAHDIGVLFRLPGVLQEQRIDAKADADLSQRPEQSAFLSQRLSGKNHRDLERRGLRRPVRRMSEGNVGDLVGHYAGKLRLVISR